MARIARVYASAAQTGIARNTTTKVGLNTADFDDNSLLDGTNNRIVTGQKGLWRVFYGVQIDTPSAVSGASYLETWKGKNGSTTAKSARAMSALAAGGEASCCGGDYFKITATTDYFELYFRWANGTVGSTVNRSVIATGIMPFMVAEWVRP